MSIRFSAILSSLTSPLKTLLDLGLYVDFTTVQRKIGLFSFNNEKDLGCSR